MVLKSGRTSKVLLDYGLRSLGLKKIVAITSPENNSSKKVLQKIGLTQIEDRKYQSSPAASEQVITWFEITN
jgi:RimJ/RimL family protein N-acetyltransferase